MNHDESTRRRRAISPIGVLVFAILVLVLLASCGVFWFLQNVGGSFSGRLDSGRRVTVDFKALSAQSRFAGDTAVMTIDGDRIEVRPDSVWVNGEQQVDLEPEQKDVRLNFVDGEISVTE